MLRLVTVSATASKTKPSDTTHKTSMSLTRLVFVFRTLPSFPWRSEKVLHVVTRLRPNVVDTGTSMSRHAGRPRPVVCGLTVASIPRPTRSTRIPTRARKLHRTRPPRRIVTRPRDRPKLVMREIRREPLPNPRLPPRRGITNQRKQPIDAFLVSKRQSH